MIFLTGLIASIVTYAFRIYVARELSVAEYGLVFAVLSLLLFVNVFRVLGVSEASVRFVVASVTKKDYNQVKTIIVAQFIFFLFTTTFLSLVLFFSAQFLSVHYFSSILAKKVIVSFLFYFVVHMLGAIPLLLLRGFQKEKAYSWAEPIRVSGVLVFTLLFFHLHAGILAPVWGFGFGSLLSFFVMVFFSRKFWFIFKYRTNKVWFTLKKLVSFGAPIMFGGFGNMVINQLDVLLITFFMGLTAVGIYNVVLPTAMIFLILGSSVSTILFPLFSELHAEKKLFEIKKGIQLIYKYILVLTLPLMLTFFAFANQFLVLTFGRKYVSGVVPFRILLIGILFFIIAHIINNILIALGHPRFIMKIFLIAATFNAIANVFLIPVWGLVGAALTTAISYFILLILSAKKLSFLTKVRLPWFSWLKAFFAGTFFLLTIFFLKQVFHFPLFFEVTFILILAYAFYLLVCYFLGLFDLKEAKEFIRRSVDF